MKNKISECLREIYSKFYILVPEQMHKILPHTTFLFGNNTEAIKFAEVMQWDDIKTNVPEIALRLAKLPVSHRRNRVVVITQGPERTIFARPNGDLKTYSPLPIRQDSGC